MDPTKARGPRDLGEGERIGEWIIVRAIAQGGFGAVYDARHARSNARVALKLLHAHLVTSPEMLARFEREIRVVGSLRHPNIVQLCDAGFSDEGRPYLCMELLDGEELGRRIERDGRIGVRDALTIFESVCDALAAAHELHIVHRDIKASNIMLCHGAPGEPDRVVLLDFGIAKISDALAPELTTSNQSLGTPSCMAPEQIHGGKADSRTDIYALGGLLFHMLTGRLPFQDPSATMTQYLHLHARRPRASNLVGACAKLDDVITRSMAIEPNERYPDVAAMLAGLRAAVRNTSITRAVSIEDSVGILCVVSDATGGAAFDEALLRDLEGVLPAAERFLSARGFSLAVDLGSSALFVAQRSTLGDPVAVALAAWDDLERRPRRDPRVRIRICVHREEAPFVGTEIQSCGLLRPALWNLPEVADGLWITGAVDPATPSARRLR